MDLILDFLSEHEIRGLLIELGITTLSEGEGCVLVQMDEAKVGAKHCLDNDACQPCGGDEETCCFEMTPEAMVLAVVNAIHRIHEGRTIMLPASKWRCVFDAVAFSMAGDESWQEFDASATIKLNTRDPLLFETGDEHTLIGLIKAIMNGEESIEQSVYLFPISAPILLHIQPGGPVKFWFGNSAQADEVREVYAI